MTCALASDWPVVGLEPLGTLHAAVRRGAASAADAGPEALSYEEALQGHTAAGAAAGLAEEDVGMIR